MYDILQNTTKSGWFNWISVLIGGIIGFTGSLIVSERQFRANRKKELQDKLHRLAYDFSKATLRISDASIDLIHHMVDLESYEVRTAPAQIRYELEKEIKNELDKALIKNEISQSVL